MDELLRTAKHYKSLGLSIVAVDARKKSVHYWQKYQGTIISDHKLDGIFSLADVWGIAIVCGKISGNLEVIDLDAKNDSTLSERFINLVKKQAPALYARLVIATTKNNGYHFMFRCSDVSRRSVLAKRPCTTAEIAANPKQKVKVLIEILGNARYVIVYPTPGYQFVQGNLERIPVISPSERKALVDIARSFNAYQQQEPTRPKTARIYYSNEISPFHDYDARGDLFGLLQQHGWKLVKRTADRTYFQRPGDTDHETSGDFHHGLGLFSVCSSSTVFEPFTGYRPYAVYAILECQGDFRLAAKKLLEEGYGIPYKHVF